ncbi:MULTISPECIES: hypothetical protein [unclassified Luteimonas]|jgi:hypothetical protein|uniref:hypothetical protein n=1 Tax=unclassified Luteimonas TaxID=2629088 RepID=UPI00047C9EDE|nr:MULTISPECIES: hypothetical protein [unclassified Luteimonas]
MVPGDGIEVIVGEEAIWIGDEVIVLPRHGAPEVLEAGLRETPPGATWPTCTCGTRRTSVHAAPCDRRATPG